MVVVRKILVEIVQARHLLSPKSTEHFFLLGLHVGPDKVPNVPALQYFTLPHQFLVDSLGIHLEW